MEKVDLTYDNCMQNNLVPIFWRGCDWENFEVAKEAQALYLGEGCAGYTSLMDSLANVRRALDCAGSPVKMMARIVLSETQYAEIAVN